MDPDENLREQKELAERLLHAKNSGGWSQFSDVSRLCELVLALSEWLEKGGFPPKAWKSP